MKTKEELNVLKKEVADLNCKLTELTDDELAEVTAGAIEIHAKLTTILQHSYVPGSLQIPINGTATMSVADAPTFDIPNPANGNSNQGVGQIPNPANGNSNQGVGQ